MLFDISTHDFPKNISDAWVLFLFAKGGLERYRDVRGMMVRGRWVDGGWTGVWMEDGGVRYGG